MNKFDKEIYLMNKFKSPCIIRLIGGVYTEGEIAIVIDFAKYGSLSSYVRKNVMSYELKVKMLYDTIRGLSIFHEKKCHIT